nr:S8/S53 family peptidase [Nocardioides sp. Root240]
MELRLVDPSEVELHVAQPEAGPGLPGPVADGLHLSEHAVQHGHGRRSLAHHALYGGEPHPDLRSQLTGRSLQRPLEHTQRLLGPASHDEGGPERRRDIALAIRVGSTPCVPERPAEHRQRGVGLTCVPQHDAETLAGERQRAIVRGGRQQLLCLPLGRRRVVQRQIEQILHGDLGCDVGLGTPLRTSGDGTTVAPPGADRPDPSPSHGAAMSQPDRSSRFSIAAWLRKLSFPWRPVRPTDTTTGSEARIAREKLRVQAKVIRDAFDGAVAAAGREDTPVKDDADLHYLYRPGHALVRADRFEDVLDFFRRRENDFRGEPKHVSSPAPGLVLVALPSRRDEADDVLTTLAEIDKFFGRPEDSRSAPIASPDHVVYVTGTKPGLCPADEPSPPTPRAAQPWPRPTATRTRIRDEDRVRVAVVDTGLWTGAIGSPKSPWLEKGDVLADAEDIEVVDPNKIHPYAGHGTFVAGVVSCLAPDTRIEVEGVLTHGGAVLESEIVEQLHQAINDDNHPQVISISAGTHTRGDFASLAFEMLGSANKLSERDDILIVAAAGNDSSDKPFWPAAFDWVVGVGSVDPDGKVSDFSNVGESWVTVYARGRDHVNAFPKGTYTCYEPPNVGQVRTFDGLARWSGTSFSTPLVTGLVAARVRETGQSVRDAWKDVLGTATSTTDPRGGQIKVVGPLT